MTGYLWVSEALEKQGPTDNCRGCSMRESYCERCPVGETFILRLERFDPEVVADASRALVDACRYPTVQERAQAGRYWPARYGELVEIAGEAAKEFAARRKAAEDAARARNGR